jgi:hypothetical protein
MADIYINTLTLRKMGFCPIENYSRYMVKGKLIMNIQRMRLLKERPDGRYNMTNDQGKRSPLAMDRIKWLTRL